MSFGGGGPVKRMGCCGLKWEREKPSSISGPHTGRFDGFSNCRLGFDETQDYGL